jgi:hypothetical protein
MILRELFESRNKSVGIIFGRFNPPHQGHKAAWNTASKFDEWYVGTNQSTQGPKDPLPFNVKIDAMKAIMPEIEGHLVAEQSWFTLASMVYKNHGAVTLHIVTDENDSKIFVPALQKSNGKEGPHGYYKFRDIVWEPAARISSATDLRAAVAANDRAAFERAAGVPADTRVAGRPFFDVVKHFLTPYLDQAAAKEADKANKAKLKADKEKAKPVKKTKEPEQSVAEGYKEERLKGCKCQHRQGDNKKCPIHGVQEGVAEGAPIVVALAPIDVRNPKKSPQPYRNKGDIVPDTKPPSTEKRGVKGRPGQRPMPKHDENVSETARMSAAAKLSKAWDQQQAKSAASRKRGQELLNPPKKEEPKPVSEKFHIFKRFKKTRK